LTVWTNAGKTIENTLDNFINCGTIRLHWQASVGQTKD
jgi:hypothetical protein